MNIVDYKIISYYNSPSDLEVDVKLALKDGWEPYQFDCEVATVLNPKDPEKFTSLLVYTQIMVKYERK